MKAVIATSTAFHLRHLAVALTARGWEVEFHSYLPRWKTRSYGLPDSNVVSHFRALLPWSALALLRGGGRWLRPVREKLFELVDRRIASTMSPADVFIGLSAVAVESAAQARQKGALVLIERGISHILAQRDIALAAGADGPSELYVSRELASYQAAEKIVLLSRFSAKTFVAQGEDLDRIETMPLGVNLEHFNPDDDAPTGNLKAIMVGGWSHRKGSDLIVHLLDSLPTITVTHVGLQDDLPFPEHERFQRLGYLNHDQLAKEFKRHHLLLFPSRDDGFGMVMAEALASGLRVIASDASAGPDLAEVIGEPWITVVPAGSLSALIAAVQAQAAQLANNRNGFRPPADRVNQLSWEGYGDRYAAMLMRLLGRKAA